MNEIYGLEQNYDNVAIEDLESERQTLVNILIDASSSMNQYEMVMGSCLNNFKQAIANSKERDEMLIAKTVFASNVDHHGYQLIDDFDTDYSAGGTTALYDAIVEAQQRLLNEKQNGYMQTLDNNGIRTKAVIAIFSDGYDNNSKSSLSEARKALNYLQSKEIIVAFIAFGDGAKGIANDLGINPENIREFDASESELRKIFMILSKSAISASKSAGVSNGAFFTV